MKPRLLFRLAIAVGAGCCAALLLWSRFRVGGTYLYALDFSTYWRGSDAFRRGVSPYVAVNAFSKLYPFGAGYLNMLPAAVFFLPLAYLPPQFAATIAEGLSVGTFAFALTRDGYWRLPLLASYPLIFCVLSAQTVPLVTAAMLIPALGFLAPIKFTLGAVGFAYNLSLKYAIGALAVIAATVICWPWWPAQWWAERHDVAGVYYHVPVLVPFGIFALASLVRWRRPDGRLVASMACIPQTMLYYDQLPLTLIAQSYRESLMVAVASWIPPVVMILLYGNAPVDRELLFARTAPVIVLGYYLPATLVVLLRRPDRAARNEESPSNSGSGISENEVHRPMA